ncbi:LytR/AlgR family response regulator transcription factor [Romboutsia sp.]|uniref:LytR/AlgR family response regulator transcription factor n=1 Tax=Romboutsia sp. TaxID=1965302 RepID=UPI003F357B79
MFNVTICWDNTEQAKILSKYLAKFSINKDFEYDLSTFSSLDKLLNNRPNHIDILLLYVELTDKNVVLTIYDKIKSLYSNIQIIFIPEILNFMLNGFALKDFAYMLQPLKYECFEEEMLACAKDLSPRIDETYINLLNGLSSKAIVYIESVGNECIVYTNNSMFQIPYNINCIEKILSSNFLFRCHNNYIVNLKMLSKIGKYYVIVNSKEVPVATNKFEELKHKLLIILNLL